jgi:hypothetical protein
MGDVPAITRRTIAAASAVLHADGIDQPQQPPRKIRPKSVIL